MLVIIIVIAFSQEIKYAKFLIIMWYGELLTTVQCSNKYDKNKPIYKIKWDNKSVESSKTPTDVTLDQLSIQSYINYCNQFQTNFWFIIIEKYIFCYMPMKYFIYH